MTSTVTIEVTDDRTELEVLDELLQLVELSPLSYASRAIFAGDTEVAEDALGTWFAETLPEINALSARLGKLNVADLPRLAEEARA